VDRGQQVLAIRGDAKLEPALALLGRKPTAGNVEQLTIFRAAIAREVELEQGSFERA